MAGVGVELTVRNHKRTQVSLSQGTLRVMSTTLNTLLSYAGHLAELFEQKHDQQTPGVNNQIYGVIGIDHDDARFTLEIVGMLDFYVPRQELNDLIDDYLGKVSESCGLDSIIQERALAGVH